MGHLGCKLSMWKAKNHCCSSRICMFYVCLGNVGLYAILGPTASKLKPTWGHVGPTLDRLGPNFPHLGSNLGTNGAILVPTWRLMGPPWCQLGPTKRHMEPIKSDMRSTWRRLGANLSRLLSDIANIITNFRSSSVILGPTRALVSVNQCFSRSERHRIKLLADVRHRSYQCVGDGLGMSIDR